MVDVPTPPFSEMETAESLRDRMLDSMQSDLDRAEGSLAFSLIAPFAVELARVYDLLDLAVELGFAQSTYGGFLDSRAEEHGIFRLPSDVATGEVTFSGVNGTAIPSGSLVSTVGSSGESPVTFEVTEAGVISGGTAVLDVVAVEPGLDGNVPAGAVTQMVGFIDGITSLTNVADFTGGVDEESDDLLRERLLAAVAAGRGAGTAGDYEIWARQVEGVGLVKATPVWSGPGTVRVMILDVLGEPASAPLIAEVEAYIATLSPIGADVTVSTPSEVVVDVEVVLVLEPGVTVGQVEASVEAAINAYFLSLGPGDDVRITEVGAAIVTTQGVVDYSGLELDTTTSNVAISDTEIAEVGVVTIT